MSRKEKVLRQCCGLKFDIVKLGFKRSVEKKISVGTTVVIR